MPANLSKMNFSLSINSINYVNTNSKQQSNIKMTSRLMAPRRFSLFNNMLVSGGKCGSCGKK